MGFLRRSKPEPRMGMPIDLHDYQMQIADHQRYGMPQDGRYWVALAETNYEVSRLVWEQPATYHEVKALIKDFEKTYRKKARNYSEYRIDDVVGLWEIEQRGKPDAMLIVIHPIVLKEHGH